MVRKQRSLRTVRRTVLIVGEGYAEEAFLRHIRALYTSKQQGFRMEIGNARGKAAGHVVDHALKLRARAQYDMVAALLDTDADWTAVVRERAIAGEIMVLPSSPCLEALLLAVIGHGREGNTRSQKTRFLQHFGGEAHEENVIARQLTRPVLDKARHHVEALDQLLKLIGY